jgi:hypothetical protein
MNEKTVRNLLDFQDELLKLYKKFNNRDGIKRHLGEPMMALFDVISMALTKEGMLEVGSKSDERAQNLAAGIAWRKALIAMKPAKKKRG